MSVTLSGLPGGACRCVDPELFFAEDLGGRGTSREVVLAKSVCGGCPVRAACLRIALRGNEQFGVWGGMTPAERRALARRTMSAATSD